MIRSSFMRLTHRCTISSKSFQTTDVGQKMPFWSRKYSNHPCYMAPASMKASIRVAPTSEEGDYFAFYVDKRTEIEYQSRIENVKYKKEVLYPGPFEVQDIKLMTGFTGAPLYKRILLRKVIE